MESKVYRPTELKIKPTGVGFDVLGCDGEDTVLLFEYRTTFNMLHPTFSIEEAEEFTKYLIEYYNHNHNG